MKDKRIYGMFGPKIKAMRVERGLKQRQLAELLTRMLKRWPDIEFMTSAELGDLIANEQK